MQCERSVDRLVVVATAAGPSQKCSRHHLFGNAASTAFPFLRVIYQIHIDPVPHPQPSPAAIMSLQDRFASQDPLSLLSGATTLSLITAASQASLAYNLPVVVCLSLCMPL